MKKAYAWVAIWPEGCNPRVSVDLFFSSKEEFNERLNCSPDGEQLIEVQVPDDFDDWDYIPDNY